MAELQRSLGRSWVAGTQGVADTSHLTTLSAAATLQHSTRRGSRKVVRPGLLLGAKRSRCIALTHHAAPNLLSICVIDKHGKTGSLCTQDLVATLSYLSATNHGMQACNSSSTALCKRSTAQCHRHAVPDMVTLHDGPSTTRTMFCCLTPRV